MTRDEEARRLALSTAIAHVNAAIDALAKISDLSPLPVRSRTAIMNATYELGAASATTGEALDRLRSKIAAETPEEDR